MAFKVQVAGVDELSNYQLVTDVVIERRIYEHSRARITMRWDEGSHYSERHTASLAARLLNCTVDVQWKDDNLAQSVDCFHGYIERVSGERVAASSSLTLDCVSFSQRTDMVPRYRAFQACKLLDICQQIARSEPLIKIDKANDLDFDIDLSIQYAETDYQYLSRMLHAWGVPMSVVDKTGEVTLGARGSDSSGKFPGPEYNWTEIAFCGALAALTQLNGGGSGPTSAARGQVGQFNSQLVTKAADYFPIPDSQPIRDRVSSVRSQIDTTCFRLRVDSEVLPYNPGEVIKFEGQDHIIRRVRITGRPQEATATQEFELQEFTLPYQPERQVPRWAGRTLWAWVMDNEKDPGQSGRIQVKFDWEPLDPPSSSDRAWLHTLTPYGAGKSPSSDKAGEYSGFYSLPEVGERVLVHFLGDWDSEAVVIGTVRHTNVNPMYNAKDTKRWRTPSGNEVTMTTKDGKEIVRLKTKDKLMFEGKIDGSDQSVTMICADSQSDMIHYQKSGGSGKLYIGCSGDIYLSAQQKLQIEGGQIQIKATMGDVRIDGMPNAFINCGPLSMTPPQVDEFQEETMSTRTKQRKLPTPAVGTAATGASTSQTEQPSQDQPQQDQPLTWIEIALKDKSTGDPVPGERYRVKLADGSIKEGNLDSEGRARVDGIKPGTAQVCFPDRDANDWTPY